MDEVKDQHNVTFGQCAAAKQKSKPRARLRAAYVHQIKMRAFAITTTALGAAAAFSPQGQNPLQPGTTRSRRKRHKPRVPCQQP